MKTRLLVIVLILLMAVVLTGCGTVTKVYFTDGLAINEKGEIDYKKSEPYAVVVQGSPGMVKCGEKISVDTRQPNFFERNIVPIFKSGVDKTKVN